MTRNEQYMFLGAKVTDWPSTFHADADETLDGLVAAYRDTVVRANGVIDACDDLEASVVGHARGEQALSMRWALVHMIEETGRHAGHLDILRELADGSTGR
jgi:uncharacterized protein DUF664